MSQADLHQALMAMLVPPGEGVFTLHHALAQRQQLSQLCYGTDLPQTSWQQQLTQLATKPTPWILGIPEDTGGGIQRGANWGPLFLRLAYYQQQHAQPITELGDVRVIPQLLLDDYVSETLKQSCKHYLYEDSQAPYPVSPLSIAQTVATKLYQHYPHAKLLGIGGDHAASYPLITAAATAAKARGETLAVLHFDAHTDLMTSRMGIPITFGSWVPHALTLLESPDLWIQLGIRQSGHDKAYWQQQFGIKQYWSADIKQQGSQAIVAEIIRYLQQKQVSSIYITVDIDVLDIAEASATGTPEANGLSYQTVIDMIMSLRTHFIVQGADLMEFAPQVHQPDHLAQAEPATTLLHILPIYASLIKVLG